MMVAFLSVYTIFKQIDIQANYYSKKELCLLKRKLHGYLLNMFTGTLQHLF